MPIMNNTATNRSIKAVLAPYGFTDSPSTPVATDEYAGFFVDVATTCTFKDASDVAHTKYYGAGTYIPFHVSNFASSAPNDVSLVNYEP